jgi:hypothetical protein
LRSLEETPDTSRTERKAESWRGTKDCRGSKSYEHFRFKPRSITASELRNPKRGAPTPLNSFTGVLKPDGRFELQIPAGKYDLHLWVSALSRIIPIRQDVVVPEGERVIVVQP